MCDITFTESGFIVVTVHKKRIIAHGIELDGKMPKAPGAHAIRHFVHHMPKCRCTDGQ